MLHAAYKKYNLIFRYPSGTSRGVLKDKETYFIKIWDEDSSHIFGLGECALFRGLSSDDRPDYEKKLDVVCKKIDEYKSIDLTDWSSIKFGVETALNDLKNGGERIIFPSEFNKGKMYIPINGLIWMGSKKEMLQRLEDKIRHGFKCVKFKIGGIDFNAELDLLRTIRNEFGDREIEIRLDANGAFTPNSALKKLETLAKFDIHSIEQPIARNQWNEMREVCNKSPIPIALDEELIGVNDTSYKKELLEFIKPQYIILKPALMGGFSGCTEWINISEGLNVGWWITSSLESNIGLNAIAQWTSLLNTEIPQGLGTGQLYLNNIESPLDIQGANLIYNTQHAWSYENLNL